MNIFILFIYMALLLIGYYILHRKACSIASRAYLNGRKDAYIDAMVEAGACQSLAQMQRLMNSKAEVEIQLIKDITNDNCFHLMKAETEDGDVKCLNCDKILNKC